MRDKAETIEFAGYTLDPCEKDAAEEKFENKLYFATTHHQYKNIHISTETIIYIEIVQSEAKSSDTKHCNQICSIVTKRETHCLLTNKDLPTPSSPTIDTIKTAFRKSYNNIWVQIKNQWN